MKYLYLHIYWLILSANNFELMNLRNLSIQYHIAALNSLKNIMQAMKTLELPSDIDNVMIVNDELSSTLNSGESIFKKYVMNSNYSKEALELYILYLRNSMVKKKKG